MVSDFGKIQGFQWLCMYCVCIVYVLCMYVPAAEQLTEWQRLKKTVRNFLFTWWSHPQITLKNSDTFQSCSHTYLSSNVSTLSVGFTVFELSAFNRQE